MGSFLNGKFNRALNIGSAGVCFVLCWCIQTGLNIAQALPDTNTIAFRNCTLTLPGTIITAPARCGWLEVAENPAVPEGGKIKLHVALAPAVSRSPKPDPVVFFAGGPGQAASEAYVMLRPILEKIRKDRDIVLVDQRGTGKSHPLKCPAEDTDTLETSIDLAAISKRARECLKNLDGDPRYYTTTIGMQDYDSVRQAMGYDRINLLGISYGTRAAQVYLRLFPGRVRSVILDSVVPMDLILGTEHARMLDRSVAATFADCSREEQCEKLFGDTDAALHDLFRQLRTQPKEIQFTHPLTGKRESLKVTADILAVAIRFLSYSSETQAVLPLLIHEAVTTGNLERLLSQALLIMTGLAEQISHGMELSVICSEDYPFMPAEQNDADTLIGNAFLSVLRTECSIWPRGESPADFHVPVTATAPVLLLTGTRDPVTPPAYAERTASHFSNRRVLTGTGLGHSVISNYCLREVATAFIVKGDLQDLDTACVGKIKPAPFFTSILGPSP